MTSDSAQIVLQIQEAIDRRHEETLALIGDKFERHNDEHNKIWHVLYGLMIISAVLLVTSPGRELILPLFKELL